MSRSWVKLISGRGRANGSGAAPEALPLKLADRLERSSSLDRPAGRIAATVRRVLPEGTPRDLLHGVPLGHPAHPPLTDVPIGCWTSAALLDLLPGAERASRALVAAGLSASVPTALTGLTDWSVLHREQQRVGLVHGAANLAATVLQGASLVARARGRHRGGRMLSYAGLAALGAGGFLGGHLAYRQAAGVNHAESVGHLARLGWHDLCPLDALPRDRPACHRLGYISLFVLRRDDTVHVLADRCAHLGGPLHQGRVTTGEGGAAEVVCPWHGSRFRVEDGAVVHGPATARQPAFETRVRAGGIVQVRPRT